jgi:hypothetical protein
MQSSGEASDPVQGFVHQALIYGSDQEFMDFSLPFIQQAVAANEPALVAVQERNIENLRAALGGAPRGVALFPVEQWNDTSARTRDKFGRWIAEHADGTRVRLIGEPPWAIGHEAQIRDWARYESVLNVAFSEYPVTFICSYDARLLPPNIIEHARSTHPEIVGSHGVEDSEIYEDPLEFCRRLDDAVSRPTGDPDNEIVFGLADLPAVRRSIAHVAMSACRDPARTSSSWRSTRSRPMPWSTAALPRSFGSGMRATSSSSR